MWRRWTKGMHDQTIEGSLCFFRKFFFLEAQLLAIGLEVFCPRDFWKHHRAHTIHGVNCFLCIFCFPSLGRQPSYWRSDIWGLQGDFGVCRRCQRIAHCGHSLLLGGMPAFAPTVFVRSGDVLLHPCPAFPKDFDKQVGAGSVPVSEQEPLEGDSRFNEASSVGAAYLGGRFAILNVWLSRVSANTYENCFSWVLRYEYVFRCRYALWCQGYVFLLILTLTRELDWMESVIGFSFCLVFFPLWNQAFCQGFCTGLCFTFLLATVDIHRRRDWIRDGYDFFQSLYYVSRLG